MTGILEQQVARIDALEAKVQQIVAHIQGAGTPTPQQPQTGGMIGAGTPTPQAGAFGLGAPQTAQTGTANVTPDMIQALITPLVANEQVKAALTRQMNEMGIQNLGDAQAHQLPELYQRFQAVEAQAKQMGLVGGAAGGAPSLI